MRTGATMRTRPPKARQTVPAPGAALVLTALVLAPLLASPRIGRADGGTVLLRATRDGLDVTLFGAPSPLRLWPWLMLPGVATALFAWREWLLERRPRGRD